MDYPSERYPSAGRFEADFPIPSPGGPVSNPAFEHAWRRRSGRHVWLAGFLMTIRRCAKGRYSEPKAAALLAETLIKRRDKVLRAWLTGVNPIVDPVLGSDGTLRFDNAAVVAGVASAPTSYLLSWSRFDNAVGQSTGTKVETRVTEPSAPGPASILEGSDFVAVSIQTIHPEHPDWTPVDVVFRRAPTGWQTVGLERTPARIQ